VSVAPVAAYALTTAKAPDEVFAFVLLVGLGSWQWPRAAPLSGCQRTRLSCR